MTSAAITGRCSKGLVHRSARPRSRPVVLFPGTATSPPDASTKAKRAEGALAPRRPGGWWRARRLTVVNVLAARQIPKSGRSSDSVSASAPIRSSSSHRSRSQISIRE